MISINSLICIVLGVILALLILYSFNVDWYCNCTGMGTQVDQPVYTFWKGAYPRSLSATDLDAPRDMSGGCSGWSIAQQPRLQRQYACGQGPRDCDVKRVVGVRADANQLESPPYSCCPKSGSKGCPCKSGGDNNGYSSNGYNDLAWDGSRASNLVPLSSIPGALPPQGSVSYPEMQDESYDMRFSNGQCGSASNLGVGVL